MTEATDYIPLENLRRFFRDQSARHWIIECASKGEFGGGLPTNSSWGSAETNTNALSPGFFGNFPLHPGSQPASDMEKFNATGGVNNLIEDLSFYLMVRFINDPKTKIFYQMKGPSYFVLPDSVRKLSAVGGEEIPGNNVQHVGLTILRLRAFARLASNAFDFIEIDKWALRTESASVTTPKKEPGLGSSCYSAPLSIDQTTFEHEFERSNASDAQTLLYDLGILAEPLTQTLGYNIKDASSKRGTPGRPRKQRDDALRAISVLFSDGKRHGTWNEVAWRIKEYLEDQDKQQHELFSEGTLRNAFREYEQGKKS